VAAAALVAVPAALLTASLVAIGVFIGALPPAVRDGFDSASGHHLVVALVVVGVLYAAENAFIPLYDTLAPALRLRVDLALRLRVLRATLEPPGIGHLEDPAILDRIRDVQGLGGTQSTPGQAIHGMMFNARQRLGSIGSAIILGTFHWWLGLGAFLLSVALRQIMLHDVRSNKWLGGDRTSVMRRSDYFRDLALSPPAAKEVRIFGLGDWVADRFRTLWLDGMATVWRERAKTRTPITAWAIPCALGIIGAEMAIGWAAVHGEISLQTQAMCAMAVITATGLWISNADVEVAAGAAAIPALLELERLTGVAETDEPAHPDVVSPPPRTAIHFDHVAFRYPGRTDDVFTDLDLIIPAGRSLAIVGLNGAGKTTLIKLLGKLYEPDRGRITVDGVDLAGVDAAQWRRHIAAIFQDFVRYPLDLRSNVGFGAPERLDDTAAVHAALEKVGLDSFAATLPNRLATLLSRQFEGGTDLSGGQWQRVALARALFDVAAGASVLVLDEPTANLDVRAEAELFDRFLELTHGLTTILVSHRFSSVRHADQICVLQDGTVVEQGSHDELVRSGGRYATMFALQASRFRVSGDDEAARVEGAEAAESLA
jgi:ATP-binding cassette subfamily B protein